MRSNLPKRKTNRKKSTIKSDKKESEMIEKEKDLPNDVKKSGQSKKKPKKVKTTSKTDKKEKNEISNADTPEDEKLDAINPQNDIIEIFDSEKDKEWGFGYEFSKEMDFIQNWNPISNYFEKNPNFDHKFSINWFSQDTEGFIPGEATKQYLIIWAWGFLIEQVKSYFDKLFPKIMNVKRIYSISADLSSDYWVDMPKREQILINGSEIISLPKNSPRRISPIPDEIVKSIPSKIPRYWTSKKSGRARDWLIPVISRKSFNEKLTKIEDYLEEYIVEQVNFDILNDTKSKKMIGVILPEEFDPVNNSEKISIPERFISFNSGFDFGGLPGNFTDMNM